MYYKLLLFFVKNFKHDFFFQKSEQMVKWKQTLPVIYLLLYNERLLLAENNKGIQALTI